LHSLGFAEAVLWVLVGNERAERFYRIDGWRPDDCERTVELWGTHIDTSAFDAIFPDRSPYWYMMNSGTGSISITCAGVSIGLSFL
jgi:hypothetical protein